MLRHQHLLFLNTLLLFLLSLFSLASICKATEAPFSATSIGNASNLDVAAHFASMQGSAVIYYPHKHSLQIYNTSLATQEFSPFSTFKIVSTLLGLEQGRIVDAHSKMRYNGKKYWLEAWNKNVTLQEAFQYSCVWYYHQLIYQLTPKTVAHFLKKLHYGNEDISQWQGHGQASMEDLNGFWLDSSLKISPIEQVRVLVDIFEGKAALDSAHVALVRQLMRQKERLGPQESVLYGKTGANGKGKSWFVGFVETAPNSTKNLTKTQRIYFAIFVNDAQSDVRHARNVALQILQQHLQ